jgi:predicted transcriptional regulator
MRALSTCTFGTLETAILDVFWTQAEPMTVRAVHDALADRGLAYTTILKTMVRMWEKGWLSRADARQPERGSAGRGRTDAYTITVSRGALLAAVVAEACERLGADPRDRSEALATLVGVAIKW